MTARRSATLMRPSSTQAALVVGKQPADRSGFEQRGAHVTLRKHRRPGPARARRALRIGSIASFSGWSRMWSDSLKKRLTVASSPTSATTISPLLAVSCGRTTT